MEKLPFFLLIFWFLFFRKFFENPYSYATSEHLENYFAYWRHTGRQIRNLKGWFKDNIYYLEPGGIPFTSAWHLPHIVTSWIGSFLKLDLSFVLYTFYVLLHYFFGSYFACKAFILLGVDPTIAFIGGTGLIYATRSVALHQALTQTICWYPVFIWAALAGHPVIAAIALWMSFSGGYTTYLFYTLPFTIMLGNPKTFIIAAVLCLPQLIHTIEYYGRTVRMKSSYEDRTVGSVPPWHFISLLIPIRLNLSGVLYPELTYRVGRVLLLAAFFSPSFGWLVVLFAAYMMMGKYVKAPALVRLPCKWSYLLTIGLVFLGVDGLSSSGNWKPLFLLVHVLDLLLTHSPLVTYPPFSEKAKKPSDYFHTPTTQFLAEQLNGCKVSGLPFPLRSGYVNGFKTLGYMGGSSLKVMSDMFGYGANGTPSHDWFEMRDDSGKLTEYEVKFAFSRNLDPLKWEEVMPGLYRNNYIDKAVSTFTVEEQLECLTLRN